MVAEEEEEEVCCNFAVAEEGVGLGRRMEWVCLMLEGWCGCLSVERTVVSDMCSTTSYESHEHTRSGSAKL